MYVVCAFCFSEIIFIFLLFVVRGLRLVQSCISDSEVPVIRRNLEESVTGSKMSYRPPDMKVSTGVLESQIPVKRLTADTMEDQAKEKTSEVYSCMKHLCFSNYMVIREMCGLDLNTCLFFQLTYC